MVLFAGASFTSCSSSDDDDNEKQEQKFDASKVMSGKWKLSKIQDFPIPINHYSIHKQSMSIAGHTPSKVILRSASQNLNEVSPM